MKQRPDLEFPLLIRRLLGYLVLFAVAAGLMWFLWLHPWVLCFATLSNSPLAIGLFPGVWMRRGGKLPSAAADVAQRRPVWNVLSELYLDTELDVRDHERIAGVLFDSPYSTGQLEEILYRELHPVLHSNLLSMAGEWVAFDSAWLEKQILRRKPRRPRIAIIPGKWMVRRDWAALKSVLRRWRIGYPSGGHQARTRLPSAAVK